ncbi:MAG: hypothetical protein MUC33_01185 [Desulfobacterales bacterium]|jgi:hypothetical protein|nr:hypothetical protein [Desulfobacterales bacterium]MCU0601256.1 hypothetical protein [Desulfobacterales bacterium]
MTPEPFPYVYDEHRGRWIRDEEPEDRFSPREIAQSLLASVAIGTCLTALASLALCL